MAAPQLDQAVREDDLSIFSKQELSSFRPVFACDSFSLELDLRKRRLIFLLRHFSLTKNSASDRRKVLMEIRLNFQFSNYCRRLFGFRKAFYTYLLVARGLPRYTDNILVYIRSILPVTTLLKSAFLISISHVTKQVIKQPPIVYHTLCALDAASSIHSGKMAVVRPSDLHRSRSAVFAQSFMEGTAGGT